MDNKFIAHLRSALHHLYDPDQLRLSPLVTFLGLEGRIDASTAVQKVLLDSIENLKPTGSEEEDRLHQREWIAYELLYFRYVRGYERQAVANQLSISDRQLSRENHAALERLAIVIWETYGLNQETLDERGHSIREGQGNEPAQFLEN